MAGLPLIERLDYLFFESMRELAQGVAAVIDDIERLNCMEQAAYEKCNTRFDWQARPNSLRCHPASCEPATCCSRK
jgi:hypothetical protein